jgi:excisionase family DNA binding protein
MSPRPPRFSPAGWTCAMDLGDGSSMMTRWGGVVHKLLLSPEEAAEVLAIGRSKLYELLAEGAIESVAIGTCRRIPTDSLAQFVDRLRSEQRQDDCGGGVSALRHKRASA